MELRFLKPLLGRPGPWASVYLDTSRSAADAAKRAGLLRRAVAGQLARQGADDRTGQAVLDRLSREPESNAPAGRAVFAAGGEVVLDVPLDASPPSVAAYWTLLPHVAPLVALHGDHPPCMVAYIDRTGADLELRQGRERESSGRVNGKELQGRGHRSIPEDRHEWHYQHRVEDHWHRTAGLVAAEICRRWPDSGAELLVLAGDPRERRAVHHRLPQPLQALTVEAEHGGRAAGGSSGLLDRQVAAAGGKQAREHLEAVLDLFRAGRGRPGEHGAGGPDTSPGDAAEGVPAVVEAARGHQVATLLLDEHGPDSGRDIWVGPEPDHLAVQRGQIRAMGVTEPAPARADDALLRSAVAADAEVLLVPDGVPGPAGGLGAVLRWS